MDELVKLACCVPFTNIIGNILSALNACLCASAIRSRDWCASIVRIHYYSYEFEYDILIQNKQLECRSKLTHVFIWMASVNKCYNRNWIHSTSVSSAPSTRQRQKRSLKFRLGSSRLAAKWWRSFKLICDERFQMSFNSRRNISVCEAMPNYDSKIYVDHLIFQHAKIFAVISL